MAADMLRTSLYVGDLHPEVTETDLAELFARAGPVLSVHLCREFFTRKSLCYAYVNFWFPAHALTALKCLNYAMMRGKSIRIMWNDRDFITRKSSIGNLFVKNLDKSITSARLQEVFSKYGMIRSCKVAEENGISKGFGFVQFDSEDSALAALNALHDTVVDGKKLYVSKFLRRIERNGAELDSRSLFVKNLDEDITEDILKEKFSEHGNISSVVIMRNEKGKSKGYGFVNFNANEAAKKALEAMNRELIGSKNVFVGRAQTKAERIKHFTSRLQGNNWADHYNESNASNLFVRNLDASVDDKKLEELFSCYGKVVSAKVIQNGGVSQGFGFVYFLSPEEAKMALNSLNGTEFKGRTLFVAVARPKKLCVKFPSPQPFTTSNCVKLPHPQPLYTSNYQQPGSTFPQFSSPIPSNQWSQWHPTSYQPFVNPLSSPNLFQAQNFQGAFCAQPMQLATVMKDAYFQIWDSKKSSSRLQGKITSGGAKELCKKASTTNTFCMGSFPDTHKSMPAYYLEHHPLLQNFQHGNGIQGMLKSPGSAEKAVVKV